MPSAIKAFAVNTTASSTVYTVPAGTVAKVILSSAKCVGNTSSSMKLKIGVSFELTAFGGSTAIAVCNAGGVQDGAGTTDFTVPTPGTFYLAAGQTITTVKTGSNAVSCVANIGVIEELAS